MPATANWRGLVLLIASFSASLLHAGEGSDPYRLTREVEPVAQAVSLILNPESEDFSGSARIDLIAHQEFSSFRLHALGPSINRAELISPDGKSTPLSHSVTREAIGLLTLSAPEPLPAGNYQLVMEFTATYQKDGLGLYKTISRGEAYLFTQFEDQHARKVFPCWDEPSFKINWQLTLTVPAHLEAVTNSPPAMERTEGNWKTIQFARTRRMQSYLVAMAVGPLEYVPVEGMSVPGRIVVTKGQGALAAEAARMSPVLLKRLEEYFNIPYPYAKLDQIAAPEFVFGAMENAGLITYSDRILLLESNNATLDHRRGLARIIAHEMAHMWFGNLVTMAWWNDFWLNESFADWLSELIVEQAFPELQINVRQVRSIHTAMRSDALPSIKPIRREVTSESEIGELIDELSYNKGKAILGMVENWIGPNTFRQAMQGYMQKHRWGNTVADDLWKAFSSASGDDIPGMLAGFIEHPGIPLISVSIESRDQVRLTQRRFNNLGDPILPGQWQVPVVILWAKDGQVNQVRLLLKEKSALIEVPGIAEADWIYPNAAEAGYYRWQLSPELTGRLIPHTASLSSVERIGLLDNYTALFNAGLLDGSDYLALLTAMSADPDPEVCRSVIGSIQELEETFITPAIRPVYNTWQRALFRPMLDRIGFDPVPGESMDLASLRARLYGALGYELADPDVVAACRRLAGRFLEDPDQADASLRNVALRVTAYHGDAAFLGRLQTAFAEAPSPIVRQATLNAIGKVHDPALAAEALAWSLGPVPNSTEFTNVAFDLSNDFTLREMTVEWAMEHYHEIAARAPKYYLPWLIFLAGANDQQLFDRWRTFLEDPARLTEPARVNIQKAADELASRLRLRIKEQASVESYLRDFASRAAEE